MSDETQIGGDARSVRVRREIWPLTMLVGLFAIATVTWPFLPDILPIHYSGDGPDGFAGRSVAVLFLPLTTLGFYCTLLIVGRDHELDDPDHLWWWVRTILVASSLAIYLFMQAGFWGHEPNQALLLGMLLTGLGWLRPFDQNPMIGVRTTWSLSSQRSWRRSNRLFRQLSLTIGVVTMGLAPFDIAHLFEIVIAALIAVVIGVVYMSYIEARRDQRA